jgi:phosphoglycolate phosphatase
LIIFDLDGTLVNSIPDLTDALNYSANFNDIQNFTVEEVTKMVGGGITLLIETAFGLKSEDLNFSNFYDPFIKYYKKHSNYKSQLYPGVREAIIELKSKKLAIISNKRDDLTTQVVKDFNIYKYFSFVLGGTDSIAKKPSAEPINFILEKLGVEKNNAIFVGDSEADIMCAKNAGIKCVAVTYGYRNKEQIEILKPDFIINNINELPLLINQI